MVRDKPQEGGGNVYQVLVNYGPSKPLTVDESTQLPFILILPPPPPHPDPPPQLPHNPQPLFYADYDAGSHSYFVLPDLLHTSCDMLSI